MENCAIFKEQRRLAKKCQISITQIAENGTMIALSKDGVEVVVENVAIGRLAIDGRRLVPIDGKRNTRAQPDPLDRAAVATVVMDSKGNY